MQCVIVEKNNICELTFTKVVNFTDYCLEKMLNND